jgi:hypothetical protein
LEVWCLEDWLWKHQLNINLTWKFFCLWISKSYTIYTISCECDIEILNGRVVNNYWPRYQSSYLHQIHKEMLLHYIPSHYLQKCSSREKESVDRPKTAVWDEDKHCVYLLHTTRRARFRIDISLFFSLHSLLKCIA